MTRSKTIYNFFLLKKKILSILLIICFSMISLLSPFVFEIKQAQAITLKDFKDVVASPFNYVKNLVNQPLTFAENIVASLIGLIFAPFKLILAWFVSGAAELNQWLLQIADFTGNDVVKEGWTILRDIANLFFILILLIIAFATILRVESYEMKKTLPRLIIIALLINFSMVICGAIIDFSQVITNFFIENCEQDYLLGIAKDLRLTAWEYPSNWSNLKADPIASAAINGVGGIVFLLGAFLAFGIGAFFLIIRIIVLWFLIILAPLAWLAYILPNTADIFQKWWSNFLKWAFFAPIYAFFIYLAVYAQQKGAIGNLYSTAGAPPEFLQGSFELILNYILLIGLLFGGLIAAQKLSITGASGAMGIAKWAGKGTARLGLYGTKLGARTGWDKLIAKKTGAPTVDEARGKIMTRLEKMPVIGKAIGGIGADKARQAKQIHEAEEKLKLINPVDLEERKKQKPHSRQDYVDRAAIMKIQAEKGKLKGDYKINEEDLRIFERMGGNLKDVFAKRPDWIRDYEMNVKGKTTNQASDELKKFVNTLTPHKASEIQHESFSNVAVQKSFQDALGDKGPLGVNHISNITARNPELRSSMDQTIFKGAARQHIKQGVIDWLDSSPSQPFFHTP